MTVTKKMDQLGNNDPGDDQSDVFGHDDVQLKDSDP